MRRIRLLFIGLLKLGGIGIGTSALAQQPSAHKRGKERRLCPGMGWKDQCELESAFQR